MTAYEVRRERIEPLWDRVDRNRWQLAIVVILFSLAMTAMLTAMLFVLAIGAVVFAGSLVAPDLPREALGWLGRLPVWLASASALGVVAYVGRTLTRSERWFAERLGAKLTATGECIPTKMMLKDMAIASGFDVAPALYVIDTPNVNAFVYGRPGRRAIVGVTQGLMDRLDAGEQRAVFANLMARLRSGDTIWASGVTALVAPLWHIRTMQMTAPDDELLGAHESAQAPGYRPGGAGLASASASAAPGGFLVFMALMGVFVVVSEFLAFGHMRTQLRHSEAADAEGMLLLKDPQSMLDALEKTIRFNNYVPHVGPGMMQLFYAWNSDYSTNDATDPQNERVARLREVLGVAGLAPVATANEPVFELVPPAPRCGDAALLPATRDPIAVGPVPSIAGVLGTALVAGMACGRFLSRAAELAPQQPAAGSSEWVEYSSAVVGLEIELLVIVLLASFVGGLVVGRSWSGIAGALAAVTFVSVAMVMLGGAYQMPGIDAPVFMGWVIAGSIAMGVTGGLLGGNIGRRLVRGRG